MEPDSKRLRLVKQNKPLLSKENALLKEEDMRIRCILDDDLVKPIETTAVYVATIKTMKSISMLVDKLSRSLPLLDLQHLKRVRKNQIIVCKVTAVSKQTSMPESSCDAQVEKFLIEHGLDASLSAELCSELHVVQVASLQPKLRWQYNEMNQIWPCKFHPNKYLELLYTNQNFSESEREFHIKVISTVKLLSGDDLLQAAGLCIDPRSNSIVATASSQTQINPLLHCPMVLVNMVARSQNGGVWDYPLLDFQECTKNLNYSGIAACHYKTLKKNFKDLKFGAEQVDPDRKTIHLECIDQQDNLSKYGPYLCTGYDVYLLNEPCLMCAMALIHSRVRRVFYLRQTEKGALGTHLKLHTVKNLNHHFEVFQIVEQDDTDRSQ